MGCIQSKQFQALKNTDEFKVWNIDFKKLYINDNYLQKLYKIFRDIDLDNSGMIGFTELLMLLDLEYTKFTKRIFSIFDNDNSGEIDFYEFVLTLWNYCTLTKTTLERFAFDLYDKDCSGELSVDEILNMITDIFGEDGIKTNIYAKIIIQDLLSIQRKYMKESLPNDKLNQLINFNEFQQFIKTHQAMLFPIHQIQSKLQKKILGKRFWEYHSYQRGQLTPGYGHTIPIGKINEYIKTIPKLINNKDHDNVVKFYYNENKQHPILFLIPNDQIQDLMRIIGTRAHRKQLNNSANTSISASIEDEDRINKFNKNKPKFPARRHHSGSLIIFQKNKFDLSNHHQELNHSIADIANTHNQKKHLKEVSQLIKSKPFNGFLQRTNSKSLDMESFLAITKKLPHSKHKILPTSIIIDKQQNIQQQLRRSQLNETPVQELNRNRLNNHHHDHHNYEIHSVETSTISEEHDSSTVENKKKSKINKLKGIIRDHVYVPNSTLLKDNISTIQLKPAIDAWKEKPVVSSSVANTIVDDSNNNNSTNKLSNYFKVMKTHDGLFEKHKKHGISIYYLTK